MVESAWIAASAAAVGVIGTATVGIVGYLISKSTNRETIASAQIANDKTIEAAQATNKATIDAAHADVQRTVDATRSGQIADRYSKAVEQLGSEVLYVRIGGIYALERVGIDSPTDQQPTVIEVLSAFIREHSRDQWPVAESADAPAPERGTRPDVQTALTVIGRRDPEHDYWGIDLRDAILPHSNLAGANLGMANLINTDLSGADIGGAYLQRAHFTGAKLTGVNLSGADLTGAFFSADQDWNGAYLDNGADLTDAILFNAHLPGAALIHAKLHGANLGGADLTGTFLIGADLTSANLWGVILSGTHFTDADLTDASWPPDVPAPERWMRDPVSGCLQRDGTS
jgi:hypothetical protein